MTAEVARKLLDTFVWADSHPNEYPDTPTLQSEEREVLLHLASGLARDEVEEALGLTTLAVTALLQGTIEKLDWRSQPEEPEAFGVGVARRPPPGTFIATAEATPALDPQCVDARAKTL